MGAFLAENFRSGFKKVGSFTILESPNGVATKVGGNVAAYFCTPDLRVIQGVVGAVTPELFLKEAKFALELSRMIQNTCFDESRFLVGERIKDLSQPSPSGGFWSQPRAGQGGLGSLMAENPLPTLDSLYKSVFEQILLETVSDKDVVRAKALQLLNDRSPIQRKAARQ